MAAVRPPNPAQGLSTKYQESWVAGVISPAPTMTTLALVDNVEYPFEIAMMKYSLGQAKSRVLWRLKEGYFALL